MRYFYCKISLGSCSVTQWGSDGPGREVFPRICGSLSSTSHFSELKGSGRSAGFLTRLIPTQVDPDWNFGSVCWEITWRHNDLIEGAERGSESTSTSCFRNTPTPLCVTQPPSCGFHALFSGSKSRKVRFDSVPSRSLLFGPNRYWTVGSS